MHAFDSQTDGQTHGRAFSVTVIALAFFPPNSIALLDNYVTVVEDRPIGLMSAKYCLPVPTFHFCPKLTHPAARCLCDR